MAFREISVEQLKDNPFTLINKDWMLITAGDGEKHNTMTASWGGVGIIWGKPSATCYIRHSRYTKEFVDNNEYFTLTFLQDGHRDALNLLGTKSGRDMDKMHDSGLTPIFVDGQPTFAEAELVLVCRKAYWQDMDPTHFLDGEIDSKWYPEKDYHRIFIGEILEVLRKV